MFLAYYNSVEFLSVYDIEEKVASLWIIYTEASSNYFCDEYQQNGSEENPEKCYFM